MKYFRNPRILTLALLLGAHGFSPAGTTQEDDFATTPPAARPMVWWHWLGQNTSKDQPRPGKRVGFCSWNYFTKDSPLMESGLLGPVRLVQSDRACLKRGDGCSLPTE